MSRWLRVTPIQLVDPVFRELRACLSSDADFQSVLASEESAHEYPTRAMAALRRAGLGELLAERDDSAEPRFTTHHIYGLNALVARLSGSLGITVGVNMLGLLPIYLGADRAQRDELLARVRSGAAVALLLTEWERGSDLKSNQTYAEAGTVQHTRFVPSSTDPSHYRVTGEKHLINAAARSELLVTLVRTRAADTNPRSMLGAAGDMSVLVMSPGRGVRQLVRHQTLPMQGAEIGGVGFEQAIVPISRRLGEEGAGFALIQRTLAFSRGGIGALASGTSSRALALAQTYARERALYGKPIAALDPIAEHLVRLDALDLAVACLSVKAACLINAFGPMAAHHGAIAKYACCELAEQAVDEGRRIMSSRALVAGDYERVVRDVLLYGVFDGTRHVMLQQIQARLRQLAMRSLRHDAISGIDQIERAYAAAPVRVRESGAQRGPLYVPDPLAHARALAQRSGDTDVAPLVVVAENLLGVACKLIESGSWDADQELGFVCARVLAWLETAFAVVELADPLRRAAFGMPLLDEPAAAERASYTVGFVAGRAADQLSALSAAAGVEISPELVEAQRALWAMTGLARAALRSVFRQEEMLGV